MYISCVILSGTRMKFTAILPRWVSTENVDQSSVNNNPHKQTSCVHENKALNMTTVITILLLMLCMIQSFKKLPVPFT